MKDKEARDDIKDLLAAEGYLTQELDKLGAKLDSLKVRYCKKCKHDTLQEDRARTPTCAMIFVPKSVRFNHYCLTCGTLREEKTVCTEVNKEV